MIYNHLFLRILQKHYLNITNGENMKFLIATNNFHKLQELQRILKPLGIDAISPREANVNLSDVEENGKTFLDNAYIKANAGMKLSGLPTIADDSGLCVDALDGRPGIYSARYGGENATDKDKYEKLLSELDEIEMAKRTAHFTCGIVCVFPTGEEIRVEGKCEGYIATKADGDGGFGYDPIFLYNGISFGKLSDEEKDSVSHRAVALKKLQKKLKDFLEENNVNK